MTQQQSDEQPKPPQIIYPGDREWEIMMEQFGRALREAAPRTDGGKRGA